MTHLNIQQGLNIEVVTTLIIKKLYEAALSVPEPLEGELDAAYMSGNLLVAKTYRSLVEYLTNRFDDLHINVTDSYYIEFEDPEVASVLLSTVSTDGIGVSEGDASLVTSFGTLGLSNHSSITSFDELKYFNNITSIPQGALDGTDNITKINLKNISTLGQASIGNKTQLSNVGLTTNLRTIGKYAFMNDSSLHNIDLTGVTTIELEAFRGAGITDINCPNLLNLNGSGNFQMSSVQTITDLGNATSLPTTAFWKCTSLTSVNLTNITTIGERAFSECTSLALPDLSNVTSIGDRAFAGCTSLTGEVELNLTDSWLRLNIFMGCPITKLTVHGSLLTSYTGNLGYNLYHSWHNLPNCTYIDLSDTRITYGKALSCNRLVTIIFPTTINDVPAIAIDNCPSLQYFILTGTTVPSNIGDLSSLVFKNNNGPNAYIYVPDSALSNYQAAFSTVSNKIKPISELPSSITWATKS